jgi:hypothetical protein
MTEPDEELPPVPVALAAQHAVDASLRRALWVIDRSEPGDQDAGVEHTFVLVSPDLVPHEPLQLLEGPEWCERAGLPGNTWRTTIVLSAAWRGFAAGQPLDEVRQLHAEPQHVFRWGKRSSRCYSSGTCACRNT